MEAQRTQQDIRFLKGRHIAYIDFNHFKISGTGETLNDFDDLLRVQLKKDKVQGFDTKWDKVLLSISKVPTLHYPQEFKHLMALYLQDTVGEQRTIQLCTTETSGLLVCGADYKGQKIQCPQRRQVSSRGGGRRKSQNAMERRRAKTPNGDSMDFERSNVREEFRAASCTILTKEKGKTNIVPFCFQGTQKGTA